MAIQRFHRFTGLEVHQGRDRLPTLEVGDVEALDAARQLANAERVAQRDDLVRCALTGLAVRDEPLVELEARVLEREAEERVLVAALRLGDAWIPREPWLVRKNGAWGGFVALAGPNSDRGGRADVGADGRLVLSNESVSLPFQWEEGAMSDVLTSSLGDVPVVVRVEVGTAQMSARDWSRIGAGDVVTLGKRIGEHVVLRVAGEDVARGELVDVDGEVGVRIVSLTQR